jgi:hypothetical protein
MSHDAPQTYYQRHREHLLALAKVYRETRKEQMKMYWKKYYQEKKDILREKHRLYAQKNAETIKQKHRTIYYPRHQAKTKAEVVEAPVELNPTVEIPRWSMIITPGCTLTFD